MNTVLQPFQQFLDNVVSILPFDPEAIGLAVGGSWASGELDAFSDLDLILVTTVPVAPDLDRMRTYAARFGNVLSSFRGDHVGEPRLLIALYNAPLLHVDIKFLTMAEFFHRLEDPVVVWERDYRLSGIIQQSTARYPAFDFQGIEDRFWVWMHYALLKIGRGEYFEALDFLAFVRNTVLGPLLHLNNDRLPRGVRRIETMANPDELAELQTTVATPAFIPLMNSLAVIIQLYARLSASLAPAWLQRRDDARKAVQSYFSQIQLTHEL